MLKKIKIDINSRIENLDDYGLSDGDIEASSTSHFGSLKIFEDEFKISYKEENEGGTVSCDILVTNSQVVVRRNGSIISTLVFCEQEPYETVYELPPYKFDMTVETKKIRSTLSENGGDLDILYEMSVGGAKKRTSMKITVSEVFKNDRH